MAKEEFRVEFEAEPYEGFYQCGLRLWSGDKFVSQLNFSAGTDVKSPLSHSEKLKGTLGRCIYVRDIATTMEIATYPPMGRLPKEHKKLVTKFINTYRRTPMTELSLHLAFWNRTYRLPVKWTEGVTDKGREFGGRMRKLYEEGKYRPELLKPALPVPKELLEFKPKGIGPVRGHRKPAKKKGKKRVKTEIPRRRK